MSPISHFHLPDGNIKRYSTFFILNEGKKSTIKTNDQHQHQQSINGQLKTLNQRPTQNPKSTANQKSNLNARINRTKATPTPRTKASATQIRRPNSRPKYEGFMA